MRVCGVIGFLFQICKEHNVMVLSIILFCVGLALLYYGAEWLVRGSSSLAKSRGVTPIVIGLTVVAFGTSTSELVVSLFASIKGKSMIAVGNVVGSNICNITLILGLAALFQPLTSDPSVVKRDIPIMFAISLYLLAITLNSQLGRIEGVTLFAGIVLYTIFNYAMSAREMKRVSVGAEYAPQVALQKAAGDVDLESISSCLKQVVFIVAGIAGVVIGAEWLIDSAVKIMSVLGVSEKFIGLTIVAFGTSLPELANSVVAALPKEMDISVGNLVGSNVFNILCVLGVASLVRPIPIPGGFVESGLLIDYCVMLFTSFLPWLMTRRTSTITRVDGLVLLACYAGYNAYLIARS
jgi:cation:H+ antiporter